jgi:hypothetical protein
VNTGKRTLQKKTIQNGNVARTKDDFALRTDLQSERPPEQRVDVGCPIALFGLSKSQIRTRALPTARSTDFRIVDSNTLGLDINPRSLPGLSLPGTFSGLCCRRTARYLRRHPQRTSRVRRAPCSCKLPTSSRRPRVMPPIPSVQRLRSNASS